MPNLEPDEDGIIDARPPELRDAEGRGDTIDQRYVYRGGKIRAFNANEFAHNAIRGNTFDVWDGTMDALPERRDAQAHAVDSLPWNSVDRIDYHITGGLTTRLGAAIFFAGSSSEPHVTLYLEAADITTPVLPIEYTLSWFDRHPGALAHVDTLAEGEAWANGELVGTVKQHANRKPTIGRWGREDMSQRATSPTYEEEYEAIATAGEIDLDSALVGAASWFQIDGPTRNTLDNQLTEIPGYSMRRSYGEDTEIVEYMDPEEKARHLYDELLDLMNYEPPNYHVAVHARKPRLQKATQRINGEMFEFAYDGSTIIRDRSNVPAWMLGGA